MEAQLAGRKALQTESHAARRRDPQASPAEEIVPAMESVEYLIVGAGFAGAATAWHLAAAGHTDVLLVDREDAPGVHSSGRNAALVRQVVPDPALARLARQ